MAEESQSAQISEYVHSMIGSYTAPEKAFHTGNEILNGLLSMKYAQAVKSGVAFTSNLYLGPDIVPYLTDADVCAVFGNLLDNAIEAAELVPSAEDRFIQLRSQTQAHFLCIVITNSRAHIPVDQEGSLLTTKKNPEFHGIGLSKVRDVMSQYGGTLALDYHEPGLFRSTLLFPLKTTPPSAEEEVRK